MNEGNGVFYEEAIGVEEQVSKRIWGSSARGRRRKQIVVKVEWREGDVTGLSVWTPGACGGRVPVKQLHQSCVFCYNHNDRVYCAGHND
jgi:hypothetical protein